MFWAVRLLPAPPALVREQAGEIKLKNAMQVVEKALGVPERKHSSYGIRQSGNSFLFVSDAFAPVFRLDRHNLEAKIQSVICP